MQPLPSWIRTLLILSIVCLAMVTGARAQHSIVLTTLDAAEVEQVWEDCAAASSGSTELNSGPFGDERETDNRQMSWDDDWGEPYFAQLPRLPAPHLSARTKRLEGLARANPCLCLPLRPPQTFVG